MKFTYYMPTRLIFGPGSLDRLARSRDLPGSKALVVIGCGGAMRRHGYLERVVAQLARRSIEAVVYDRVQPNPLAEQVDEGACVARDQGCDVVIGLGGGSTIDAAKGMALMATNSGNYWDYITAGSGGRQKAPGSALPLVAIPTTAGTGSEVDPWTVITNRETSEKIGWGRDDTYPVLALVDPELMLSVPPRITAHTGIDAFFHAVEAYLASVHQPASDLLALEAIGIIARDLPLAVADGGDIAVRTRLAWASTAAGMCESLSSCISHHSMEHALSAFHPELPHGAGLARLSVPYFTFLAQHAPARFPDLARAMVPGAEVPGTEAAATMPETAQDFVTALAELLHDIGLDEERLSDYGVLKSESVALAQNAMETMGALFRVTPARMSRDDVIGIYEKALQ